MKANLPSRVEQLETHFVSTETPRFCYGFIQQLPSDYEGERHVVTVTESPRVEPAILGNRTWDVNTRSREL
jgi:hypothetical protein